MNFKKILLIIVLIVILVSLILAVVFSNTQNTEKTEKKSIVVTNFATYDFIRQIAGDTVDLNFLLGPGVDSHSYDPTAKDIIDITKADMFVYVGGEIEPWAEKIVPTINSNNLICIKDLVNLMEEKEIDGAEEHHGHEGEEHKEHEEVEYDEHIWTSLENSTKIIEVLKSKLVNLIPANREFYTNNANRYIAEINNVKLEIQSIVENKVRNRLVFGDKMPMQYFISEFDLEVSAAFSGCSTETEPSSSTIAYLVNKIKNEKIPVVLYIELSNGTVAKTIADETDAKALQIQSLHNVSKQDFNNGETYVTLMRKNMNVLKEALQ